MRLCLELCHEFPVEDCLLKLIDYSEALEDSSFESRIDEIEELVIAYLTHPAKLFTGKLIIQRLQI